MSGVALEALPPAARSAWAGLRDRLLVLLGRDLVAVWAHGGTISLADPAHGGDLDTYVIVARRPVQTTARRIEMVHDETAAEHGVEWDSWYVLADDARGSAQPRHAWHADRRDTSWAIHRAHWLAGRHATLHGPDPGELVPAPRWGELVSELDRELEHIERHVVEGDTDPYEATYALLTGSRILHALATQDVTLSKRAAGAWGLEHLPDRWHAPLRAAIRTYEGAGTPADEQLLSGRMADFVAFVRERLPPTWDRPADAMPRWSGF